VRSESVDGLDSLQERDEPGTRILLWIELGSGVCAVAQIWLLVGM
jgi:hypothetical protein